MQKGFGPSSGHPGSIEADSAPLAPAYPAPQAKILEHDDVSYLKKILGELAMVLDQIEAELEKRKLENEGGYQPWGRWVLVPSSPPSLPSTKLFHSKDLRGPPRWFGSRAMESDRPSFKS